MRCVNRAEGLDVPYRDTSDMIATRRAGRGRGAGPDLDGVELTRWYRLFRICRWR